MLNHKFNPRRDFGPTVLLNVGDKDNILFLEYKFQNRQIMTRNDVVGDNKSGTRRTITTNIELLDYKQKQKMLTIGIIMESGWSFGVGIERRVKNGTSINWQSSNSWDETTVWDPIYEQRGYYRYWFDLNNGNYVPYYTDKSNYTTNKTDESLAQIKSLEYKLNPHIGYVWRKDDCIVGVYLDRGGFNFNWGLLIGKK